MFRVRNNIDTNSFSFYDKKKKRKSSSKNRSRSSYVLAVFHNFSSDEVSPLGAIIDVGASKPIVSKCALDEYRSRMEKEYPELNDRIVSTPINLQPRVANGETLRSTESICVPVRIDFSEDYSQTAFAVTDTGKENIPFLVAMPQLSKLYIMINTTPGHGYMVSRRTGVAYKLRKPRQPNAFHWK